MNPKFVISCLALLVVAACSKDNRVVRNDLTGTWKLAEVELLTEAPDSSYYEVNQDTVDYVTDTQIIYTNTDGDSSWTDTAYIETSYGPKLSTGLFDGISYIFAGCKKLKVTCDGGYKVKTSAGTVSCPMKYSVDNGGSTINLAINFYGHQSDETWEDVTFVNDSSLTCSGSVYLMNIIEEDTSFNAVPALLTLSLSDQD